MEYTNNGETAIPKRAIWGHVGVVHKFKQMTSLIFETTDTFPRPASEAEIQTKIYGGPLQRLPTPEEMYTREHGGLMGPIQCLQLQMKDEQNRVWVLNDGPSIGIEDHPDGTCTVLIKLVYVQDLSIAAAGVEPFPELDDELVQCWENE